MHEMLYAGFHILQKILSQYLEIQYHGHFELSYVDQSIKNDKAVFYGSFNICHVNDIYISGFFHNLKRYFN